MLMLFRNTSDVICADRTKQIRSVDQMQIFCILKQVVYVLSFKELRTF
jgi:hypothetical protein